MRRLTVPNALEANLLPLIVAYIAIPSGQPELMCERLAAPSIAVRFNALAVLQRWPVRPIDASIWELIDTLADDSVPQVRDAASSLLERSP